MAAQRRKTTMFTNLHLKGSTLHYGQEYLQDVMAGAIAFNESEIRLVREPSNKYDPNAVAVWWRNDHEAKQLGYVARNQAPTVARCLDNGGKVLIKNHSICGSSDNNYGLYLGVDVLFRRNI